VDNNQTNADCNNILLSIPASSITVIHNAPYHTVEHIKASVKYTPKSKIIPRLEENIMLLTEKYKM
jgi:hypothetical protein